MERIQSEFVKCDCGSVLISKDTSGNVTVNGGLVVGNGVSLTCSCGRVKKVSNDILSKFGMSVS